MENVVFNTDGVLDPVSMFSGVKNSRPDCSVSLWDVLEDIRSHKYRDPIEACRKVIEDPVAYQEMKKLLPAFTVSGTFSPTRNKANVASATGFLIADFDHMFNVEEIFSLLSHDPNIWFIFISPSGSGLKAGIRAAEIKTDDDIKILYNSAECYFKEVYALKIDPACKDISRLTFVSHDPNLFINESPIYFDVKKWEQKPEPSFSPPTETENGWENRYAKKVLDRCCREIALSKAGEQHSTRLRMARLVGGYIASGYISESEAMVALEESVIASGVKMLKPSMNTVKDGIRNGKQSPIHLEGRKYTFEYTSEPDPPRSDEWDEPIPIQCELLPVEPFNPEWLPDMLRGWVMDIADRMRCPIDYPAIGAMVTYSALVGKKIAVKPKKNDNWVIPPNLWGCVIGRPSAKKTPSLEQCLKLPYQLEIKAKDEYELQKESWLLNKMLKNMEMEDAKKAALKSAKSGDRKGALEILKSVTVDDDLSPTRKRYVVNDTTVEKLGEILSENPNGILIFRDELFGFFKIINREDKSNDRSFYMEAWTGLGRYSYDRIGRGTIDIESCIVSILGCLTPSKVVPMVCMAVDGGIDDDGLLQRFQLMVYPDQVPWRYVDRIPDKDARDDAYTFLEWVSELEFLNNDEFCQIPVATFSDDAQELFIDWLSELEAEISSPDIHPAIESHLAKYRSLIPSIALLIHIGSGDQIGQIRIDELEKAISWGKYLKSHALRIYGLALNNKGRVAKILLNKIKAGKLNNPFVIRDVKRAQWQGLTDDLSVDNALTVLLDGEYLKITKTPTGGKPKIEYHINPNIFKNTPSID